MRSKFLEIRAVPGVWLSRPGPCILIAALLVLVVPWGDSAGRDKAGVLASWYAPDSAWALGLVREVPPERLANMARDGTARSIGFKFYMAVVDEPGVWMVFVMKLGKVERVTFTKNTKIVVTDVDGRRVESEGVFFWPDALQTVLYDSRRGPVVVSKTSVWRGPRGWWPVGGVKFPAGSFKVADIARVEVFGAVEDRGGE